MVDLASLQKAFGAAILAGDEAPAAALEGTVAGGALSPVERLRVYRNNFRQGLSDSLAGLFPVVTAFVGDVFLKAALRHYIVVEPPTEPMLHRYGGGFADFLRGFEPARKVPYVADLARLEWAVHSLMTVAEAPALAADASLLGRPVRLTANARLIVSAYPVVSLWMVGTRQLPPEAVDAGQGGQTAVVLLLDGRIEILPLEGALGTLAADLETGGMAVDESRLALMKGLLARRLLADATEDSDNRNSNNKNSNNKNRGTKK